MTPPSIPSGEPFLPSKRGYVNFLDPPLQESLTRLTHLASQALQAPIGILTLGSSEGPIFIGSTGLSKQEAAGSSSGNLATVLGGGELTPTSGSASWSAPVPTGDVLERLGLRAVAAVSLRPADSDLHGSLYVADRKPREWRASQRRLLEEIGLVATHEIDRQVELLRSRSETRVVEHRSAEILAQEGLFRTLVEQSLVGIAVVDGVHFEYVNPKMAEIFGYTPEEMTDALAVLEIVCEGDRDLVRENLRKRLAGEVLSIRYHFGGLRKDGSRVEVEVHGSRVELDGRPMVIATVLDISAQIAAEGALKATEERYRLVVSATKSAVLEWDVAAGTLLWDGKSHRLLRHPKEELGRDIEWWYERIHPDDRPEVIRTLHAHLNGTTESCTQEYRFRRSDDGYIHIQHSCCIVRNDNGEAERVVGMMTDVTDRRQAEEAQRFLANASLVMDGSLEERVTLPRLARLPIPWLADYCLVDLLEPSGLRRAVAAHIDPGKEDLLYHDEYHPLDADILRHPVVSAVRNHRSILISECTPEILDRISHDEEHRRSLEQVGLRSCMIVPLRAHGTTLGALTLASTSGNRRYTPADLVTAEDFAQRAGVAIAHNQLYRQARDATRAREEVLNVVSHDLRNPLNTVQLCASMMLDLADDRRSSNVKTLEIIMKATRQMNLMIDDLLDISSLESGRFSLDPSKQDPETLLGEALSVLQPIAEKKGITLTCTVDPDVPALELDQSQILRVLSNLVGNAIKFSYEDGAISIRVSRKGEQVRFSISDHGPGIPEEQLPHVFNRYWQAAKGDRRGVGLGLAISKGIVEAHGGKIEAESVFGQGATFHFSLPTNVQRRKA